MHILGLTDYLLMRWRDFRALKQSTQLRIHGLLEILTNGKFDRDEW